MDSSVTVQDEFTNTHGSLSALPLLPIGDRLTRPDGLTELRTPGSMRMSDWELQDATCCQSLCLSLRCSVYDKERAFIRLRDNSLEINDTNSGCKNCGSFCGKQVQDNISVYYFDRPPFAKHECAPFPFCCCGPCGPAMCSPFPCCCCAHRGRPKLEVASRGCVCCCTEFSDEWDLHPFCRYRLSGSNLRCPLAACVIFGCSSAQHLWLGVSSQPVEGGHRAVRAMPPAVLLLLQSHQSLRAALLRW